MELSTVKQNLHQSIPSIIFSIRPIPLGTCNTEVATVVSHQAQVQSYDQQPVLVEIFWQLLRHHIPIPLQ